ncbi:hypothetical protein [Paenibacillus azoreducens]|uniref:Uncharacterized protein n=1 Tax=Paenibacillus azoreducens TaxID=116718 RepID=A0A919YFQ4_9BACL|nr:hypothetical protein [Paenibacillus azoreducens]GIO48453.1 hypothetical protein J34TS1_32180 [Paenibacillus azoreducens]
MNNQMEAKGHPIFHNVPIGNGAYSKKKSSGSHQRGISPNIRYESSKSPRQQADFKEQLSEIMRGKFEVSTASSDYEKDGDNMDETLKMMLERIERDSREREERYHQDAREREERYYQEIKEQKEDAKERDDRILKQISEMLASQQQLIDHKLTLIDGKMNHVSSDMSHTRDEMTNLTGRIDNLQGRVDSSKYFVIGSVIAILIGIGSIVYANWQVISAMLQMSGK